VDYAPLAAALAAFRRDLGGEQRARASPVRRVVYRLP
jgi:hypothetical protein